MNQNDFHGMRKRDWSNMKDEICLLIEQKLWFDPYRSKFAQACKDWYRITKKAHDPCQETSVSMLIPYIKKMKRATCTVYFNSETFTFRLPQLRDRWVHGCSKGWLATIDRNLQIILVNPLSRAQIKLPHLTGVEVEKPLDPSVRNRYISKLVISENPLRSPDCLIVAIMTDSSCLFACRPDDNSWTPVRLIRDTSTPVLMYEMFIGIEDVIFFQGKIIAINNRSFIVVDYGSEGFHARYVRRPYQLSEPCNYGGIPFILLHTYLVECSGDLLVVLKYCDYPHSSKKPKKKVLFRLYKVEKGTNTFREVNSLGDMSLFLGASESISVTAKEVPGCQPNHIYYADCYQYSPHYDYKIGFQINNGVFSLDDNSFETLSISHTARYWGSSAMWYQRSI